MRGVLARAARRLDPDDVDGLHRLLRRFSAREVVRIALRDLRRARVDEVTGALSSLATSALQTAIAFHDRRLRRAPRAARGARRSRPGGRLLRHRHGQAGGPRAQLLVGHRPHLRLRAGRHDHRRAPPHPLRLLREAGRAGHREPLPGHRGRDGLPGRPEPPPRRAQRTHREQPPGRRALLPDLRPVLGAQRAREGPPRRRATWRWATSSSPSSSRSSGAARSTWGSSRRSRP